MARGGWNPRTANGASAWEVISALQKAIRRGETDNAIYWAVDLDLGGFSDWLWRRLQIIASEDIGPAWPEGPAQIRALYDNWKDVKAKPHHEGALFIVHAVILMSRAPKSRLVDEVLITHYAAHRELFREVPDEALDQHTAKGKSMGRGVEHFYTEGNKLHPHQEDPDEPYYRDLAKKLLLAKKEIQERLPTAKGVPEALATNGRDYRNPGAIRLDEDPEVAGDGDANPAEQPAFVLDE